MRNAKLFISLLLFTGLVQAETEVKSTPAQGAVQFEATGKPAMIKIKGQGEGAAANLNVNEGKVNGDIKFNIESLKTGIELRDEHMKTKYLHAKEYPQATLQLKDLELPKSWSVQNAAVKDQDFKAILKLHGVEKEVRGQFSIASNKLDGRAQFEVKLSDFKIDIAEYLGVKVADTVKVTVQFDEMSANEKAVVPASKKKN